MSVPRRVMQSCVRCCDSTSAATSNDDSIPSFRGDWRSYFSANGCLPKPALADLSAFGTRAVAVGLDLSNC